MKFEWDENKNRNNIIKHAIDFETAVKVFKDPFRIEMYDFKHSVFEDRYITIGEVGGVTCVIMLVYAQKNDHTRIISARKATSKERRLYNDSKKKN